MKIEIFHVGVVCTNSYIIEDEDGVYLIDPGDNGEMLLRQIGDRKLKYIFLTHGHFDHILAAEEIRKQTGAKIVASRFNRLDDEDACGFTSFGLPGFVPIKPDITVKDGDVIDGFEFLETPGHTPCCMCIKKGDTLFSGDTLFAGSCGRCDLVGGDYNVILKSLARLATLSDETKVYPGHGDATTIGREKKTNPYMYEAIG